MARSRSHAALAVLLVVAALFYAVFIGRTSFRVSGRQFFTLIDDAMISMRYAQHLGQGSGLLWNIGEPPIQGFTNPGWMLVMALLHAVAIPQSSISLAVMAVSAAILLANAVVVQRICLAIDPAARVAPLFAAAATAFYFPLVFWSLRGMEVGLLALLVDLAVLAALHAKTKPGRAVGAGLLLAAAVFVRLDAIAQAAIVLAYFFATRVGRRHAWLSASILAATLIAILLFQWAYFGDALPNTYYLKLAGGAIDARIKHGALVFIQYGLRDVIILSLVAMVGFWRFRELRNPEALLLAGLFAVQCAYSIWVGGDYAEPEVDSANRFIAQGVPALIILSAMVIERSLSGGSHGARLTSAPCFAALSLAGGAIVLMSGVPWYRWVQDNAPLLRSDIRRVRAGLAIAAYTSPDAVIAVHAAGQIPYYSERKSIDLLGLNDAVIARGPRRTNFYPGHDKWDYEYSIAQQQPDLIADNWIRLADYMRGRSDYKKLANGMYVRSDTALVDEIGLQEAFP